MLWNLDNSTGYLLNNRCVLSLSVFEQTYYKVNTDLIRFCEKILH